jgi:hypothetical protein
LRFIWTFFLLPRIKVVARLFEEEEERMRRLLLLSLLSLLLAGSAFAQGNSGKPDPKIAFEDAAVTASGLTPGKAVIWLGVEHAVDAAYSGDIWQHYNAGTAAADGTARLDLEHAPAPLSVWVVVDLDSGAFAVTMPDGRPIKKPGKPSRVGLGDGDKADELLDDRQFLMGLMVRPGEGAWAFTGGDGGPRDEDGKPDGHLRFALDRLRRWSRDCESQRISMKLKRFLPMTMLIMRLGMTKMAPTGRVREPLRMWVSSYWTRTAI